MTAEQPTPPPSLVGTNVCDPYGAVVGRVRGTPVSADDTTWIAVELTGTGTIVSVPYDGTSASSTSPNIVLPFTAHQLRTAPPLFPAAPAAIPAGVTPAANDDVTSHPTAFPAATDRADAVEEDAQPSGNDTTPVVTRSEEQVRVTTERYPYQQIRLRKRVVTEERTISVTVRREELVVDRIDLSHHTEPDAPPPSAPTPRDIELILHTEEPVIDMTPVPVERIRVHIRDVDDVSTVNTALTHEEVTIDVHPAENPSD